MSTRQSYTNATPGATIQPGKINLHSHREHLVSQLNIELSLHVRKGSGNLPVTVTTLLSRIQRVNDRLVNRQATAVNGIIQKQDELAHRVFDLHESSDELRNEINAVGKMLERRADSYIAYDQQPSYNDFV